MSNEITDFDKTLLVFAGLKQEYYDQDFDFYVNEGGFYRNHYIEDEKLVVTVETPLTRYWVNYAPDNGIYKFSHITY